MSEWEHVSCEQTSFCLCADCMERKWKSLRWVKDKIRGYRRAPDAAVMRCINDRPTCGYAEIQRRFDLPFALREAGRRGLMEDIDEKD